MMKQLESSVDPVLERIGFKISTWDQLNWFVQFSRKPLERLTPGELLSLQEEVRAIAAEIHQGFRRKSLPSLEQITGLQREVIKHLTELVDKQETEYGP